MCLLASAHRGRHAGMLLVTADSACRRNSQPLHCADMGSPLELKPTHEAVVAYYEALAKFDKLGVKHEGAVASAFEDLLEHCARLTGRVLIPKYSLKRKGAKDPPFESTASLHARPHA